MGPSKPSKTGPLELLAAVEGVPKLEETAVVLGNAVNLVSGRINLSQGQLVVILVIEDIQEVSIEGMNVLHYHIQ
jgi:hypothetical protein